MIVLIYRIKDRKTFSFTGLVTKEEKVNTKAVAKAYDYDILGNRTKMEIEVSGQKALNMSYKYDAMNRLTHVRSAGKELSSFKSVYDLKGRKIEEEEKLQNKDNKNETITKKYVYDKLNRLVKESQTGMVDNWI